MPNENVEKYKRLILIDFIEGDLNPKDVLSGLANSLENSKKQNPVINYKVYKKNNEYIDSLRSCPVRRDEAEALLRTLSWRSCKS